jgi:hypothetical protein
MSGHRHLQAGRWCSNDHKENAAASQNIILADRLHIREPVDMRSGTCLIGINFYYCIVLLAQCQYYNYPTVKVGTRSAGTSNRTRIPEAGNLVV